MRLSKTTFGLLLIFAISIVAYIFLPIGLIRNIIAVPAVGSLFLAWFQLLRDSLEHARARSILDEQNRFSIGAMSHMANVAFDKHVLFCEAYAAEMFNALNTLFAHGPHRRAIEHHRKLFTLRRNGPSG